MSDQHPTPDPQLNVVLRELLAGMRQTLGDALLGAYLQGSFAMGDWDEHSDVDFLAVTAGPLAAPQLDALQAMHRRVYALPIAWAQHLEGSYFPAAIIGGDDPARTPLPYLDNGARDLVLSNHCNTRVVRWVTREHGIPLAGPPASALIAPVSPDALRQEIAATMREWGRQLIDAPAQMNNRWYQPFAVLSYCRMLHSLQTGMIHSKPASAAWAQANLDPQWTGLIRRAWVERQDPWTKVDLPADPEELTATLRFVAYALGQIQA